MTDNLQLLLVGIMLSVVLIFRPVPVGIKEPQSITFSEPLTTKEFLKKEVVKAGLSDRDFYIISAIISCESSWEQKYKNGEVKVSNGNIGLAQINRFAHEKEYEQLGLDPFDEFQNIQYAIILYKRNGIKDWEQWSGHCFIPLLASQGIIIK